MEREVKYIDIKEFREKGYLQELNRRFLHPLGLALEIQIDDNGEESLKGIWDFRDDKEGIHFDFKNRTEESQDIMIQKMDNIHREFQERCSERIKALGFVIESLEK